MFTRALQVFGAPRLVNNADGRANAIIEYPLTGRFESNAALADKFPHGVDVVVTIAWEHMQWTVTGLQVAPSPARSAAEAPAAAPSSSSSSPSAGRPPIFPSVQEIMDAMRPPEPAPPPVVLPLPASLLRGSAAVLTVPVSVRRRRMRAMSVHHNRHDHATRVVMTRRRRSFGRARGRRRWRDISVHTRVSNDAVRHWLNIALLLSL